MISIKSNSSTENAFLVGAIYGSLTRKKVNEHLDELSSPSIQASQHLFDIIEAQTGNKVLWTTNIWSSEMLHWNEEPEQLEIKYKRFKERIPEDLTLYGHDYVAIDLNESVNNDYTHVRYK